MFLSKLVSLKIFRYLLVGACSAIVDVVIFSLLVMIGDFQIVFASTISFGFAILINYYFGITFVFIFKANFELLKEFVFVFLTSLIGLVINVALVYWLIDVYGCNVVIAKILAVFPTFFWNYGIRNLLIYKKK